MEDTDPLTPPDDRARLNAILDGLLDRRRRIAALQAEEAELLHAAQEFALARHDAFAADRDEPDDLPLRSVAAEIGVPQTPEAAPVPAFSSVMMPGA